MMGRRPISVSDFKPCENWDLDVRLSPFHSMKIPIRKASDVLEGGFKKRLDACKHL